HRPARVEEHRDLAVGLAAIALQIGALGAGEHVPVDVAKVVARIVRAILGEFLTESEIRRAMQTRDEAIDHSFRNQLEAGDSGESSGVEEALHGVPFGPGAEYQSAAGPNLSQACSSTAPA